MAYTPKTRAFWPASEWGGPVARLDEEQSHHLCGVLRLAEGTPVDLLDGAGRVAHGVLSLAHKKHAEVEVVAEETAPPPSPRRILVQALVREQKMDWLLQKAVELAVTDVWPVQTAQCVVRISAAESPKKQRRWESIARAACLQSGNPWMPGIRPVRPLDAVLPELAALAPGAAFGALRPGAVPYPEWLRRAKAQNLPAVAVCVGPEGDFSDRESDTLLAAGVAPVTLGPTVLRVETASLFMLSALRYEWLG